MDNLSRNDRRRFLRGLGVALATGTAGMLLPQLDLIGRAAAATASATDYRALVCIFLYGGNDSHNMLVPYAQPDYNAYLACRGGVYDATANPFGLGLAREALLPISEAGGKTWGLHPACAGMQQLFGTGELAFLANTGSLVAPVTRAQALAGTGVPQNLYSHNDQQSQWMRGHATSQHPGDGWGGLVGDVMEAGNSHATALPPTLSLFGNNLYQTGKKVLPYSLSTNGVAELARMGVSSAAERARMQALDELLRASHPQLMQDEYAVRGLTSIQVNDVLRSALLPANNGDINTVFPGDFLAQQLRMTARLIKISQTAAIGHKRQVYFVGLGGFDTHDNQMDPNRHAALLGQLSGALLAFRNGLSEIGMLNNVVTFSMSDFSRTLNSNGNGTDHGWGGVQLVMGGGAANGGPLQGRKVWGTYPLLELDGPQSTGRGRLIPTTAVQQMGATLATWLGVESTQLDAIFPGLGNFSSRTLGFLS
jgi:uncharacterized protein (DUF1501 family)